MASFRDILNAEIEAGRAVSEKTTAPGRANPRDLVAASFARATVDSLGAHTQRRANAKRRFRARALATHPDRGGCARAFMAVVQAYELELAAA